MIPCAVLMCHAPIVVPEVGGPRSEQCATTTRAMGQAAERLVGSRPDVLVVISPHAPRHRRAWGVTAGPLRGDLARFGAPEVALTLPVADDAVTALRWAAVEQAVEVTSIPGDDLDHGAMVPLCFVVRAGWTGPTILVALPWEAGTAPALGRAIARASAGRRWSILASGDMSHRLIPGAPSGYHPRAHDFDQALVDAVSAGDLRAAAGIDHELREVAAEDAVDSLTVAAAAVDWDATGHERLAYEGPFGVGYMEAVLHRAG